MRPYIVIFACLLIVSISSCKRDFDCSCVTRGARTEYVEQVRAENKDEAFKKCADYQGNVNVTSSPGVDCELK